MGLSLVIDNFSKLSSSLIEQGSICLLLFTVSWDSNNDGEGRFCAEAVHSYAAVGIPGSVYHWAHWWLFWFFSGSQSHRWVNEAHRLAVSLFHGFSFLLYLEFSPSCLILIIFFFLHFPASPDEIPECSSLRVPKIWTIFGIVGMLRLLAGRQSLRDI